MNGALFQSKMTKSRGKVSSTKGLVKGLAPKVLKPKFVLPPQLGKLSTSDVPTSPATSLPTPPPKETNPAEFSTDILSNAPLDGNIGPKKPVSRIQLRTNRATTGVVIPDSFRSDPIPNNVPIPDDQNRDTPTPPLPDNVQLPDPMPIMTHSGMNGNTDRASQNGLVAQNGPPPVIRRSFPPPIVTPNFPQMFPGPPPIIPSMPLR